MFCVCVARHALQDQAHLMGIMGEASKHGGICERVLAIGVAVPAADVHLWCSLGPRAHMIEYVRVMGRE